MAIGKSKLDELLRRGRHLDEKIAWMSFFDGKTRAEIIAWIQDRLKNKGTDKNNNVIGYYSLATELITNGAKKFNTHYTLLDSGDFYASMFLAIYVDEFVINANSDKGDEDLFEKYGTGIIGLTDEEISMLVKKLKVFYVEYVKATLKIS